MSKTKLFVMQLEEASTLSESQIDLRKELEKFKKAGILGDCGARPSRVPSLGFILSLMVDLLTFPDSPHT